MYRMMQSYLLIWRVKDGLKMMFKLYVMNMD